MFEFLRAALPWLLIAISVAVLAANHIVEKKKKAEKTNDDYRGNRMTEGMCIGMCIGVALGSAGVFNIGVGISLGMIIGEAVGMCIKK